MNKERMLYLADALDKGSLGHIRFDMSRVVRVIDGPARCPAWFTVAELAERKQVTCCPAGFAVMLFGKPDDIVCDLTAIELLGLTIEQGHQLFYDKDFFVTRGVIKSPYYVTNKDAAVAVRRMVAEQR